MRRAMLLLFVGVLLVTVGILSFAGSAWDSTPEPDQEDPNVLVPAEDVDQIPVDMLSFEPILFPLPPATCGGNVCGPGTYCCNPSCGTCTPFGASCTQQVCNPDS